MLANGMLFFYLFLDFYQKTYSSDKKSPEKIQKPKPVVNNGPKSEKQTVAPGSEFWKVITHGMSFMCFPGLQDELYNDDDTDKTQ